MMLHVHLACSSPTMTVGSMSSHPCASLQRQPDQAEEVRRSLHPLHGFQLAPHVSHKVALDKYRSSFCALLGRRLPHLSLRYAKAQAPTLASLDGLAHLVPENARVAVLSVNTAGTMTLRLHAFLPVAQQRCACCL